MRKWNVALIFLLAVFSVHSQGYGAKKKAKKSISREYGMAGCGLGSILMGKNDNQVFASTTNGTTTNQYLGITFGTLNCLDAKNYDLFEKLEAYLQVNSTKVLAEAARGGGEHTKALAQIFGCAQHSQRDFDSAMQRDFSLIFRKDLNIPDLSDSVTSALLKDEKLRESCTGVNYLAYS